MISIENTVKWGCCETELIAIIINRRQLIARSLWCRLTRSVLLSPLGSGACISHRQTRAEQRTFTELVLSFISLLNLAVYLKLMADEELEAIRRQRMAELQTKHGVREIPG